MDLHPAQVKPARIELIRSLELPDGSHSGLRLKNEVNAGEVLRLRRGVYVRVSDWLNAPPWERHLAATAATQLNRAAPIFCRETALALHGINLLGAPQAVQLRTDHQGGTRLLRPSPMTGSADPTAVIQQHGNRHRNHHQQQDDDGAHFPAAGGAAGVAALRGIPTRLHEHVRPPRTSRPETRRLVRGGFEAPQQELEMGFRDHWPADVAHCLVEDLGLVLADTVPRMEEAAGVVVLDAVLGGRVASGVALTWAGLSRWESWIHSQRLLTRWRRALQFADPLSESAGESLSRVRIHELGFEQPVLQVSFELGSTVARVDFYWPGCGVVGEFDGKVKYLRADELSGVSVEEVVWREKLREDALRARGLRVVRWTWEDLRRPGALEARLRAAGVPLATKKSHGK
ncbi:hypothetical protein [Nesterenkonia halotolerans]|uniref:Type IV toxin-antitoxin system AbiEi family antitoxin domain-containing protein n=1 Tax=Nesterenkonia halotolerans TaxID=225325 RepID=A0ABR9J9I7_9MICC|nr:hypothetical protein [Nesterenkonia halotolerans]MBE1515658.1 hypothetical protein [Nesterenkonia halotolerans]